MCKEEFLQQYPQSHIQLQVQNTRTIVEQIANHTLDLGMIEGECNHPDIAVAPWIADELVIFAAPTHPLAQVAQTGKTIHKSDLLLQPWIVRERGSGTRETFDRTFKQDYSRLNITLELEHTEAIKRAVESGLGIGCISRLALRDAFRRGSLVALETPELDLSRQFYFIWHKQKFQSSAMREFLRQCQALTAGVRRSDEIELSSIVF